MDGLSSHTGSVPGQVALPGMADALGYESIVLRPDQERVCWEYVLRNNGTKAYKAIHPEVSDETAAVQACKMLRKDKIVKRIGQIRDELRRRYEVTAADLMEYHGKVLKIDRREYLDELGKPQSIEAISSEAASILEFDVERDSKFGTTHVMFKVPQRHQSAVELAKILGLHKDKMELTGKDGGPIATENVVRIYIPDNGRDNRD
jgi:phage terminase small subunit